MYIVRFTLVASKQAYCKLLRVTGSYVTGMHMYAHCRIYFGNKQAH